MTEKIDEQQWNMVAREDYNQMVLDNPGLRVMPKEMRRDLPPLPSDIQDHAKSSIPVPQIAELQKPAVAAVERMAMLDKDRERLLDDSYSS